MALTFSHYELVCTLVDNNGDRSNLRYILTAADDTAATTDATTIRNALLAVTNATLVRYNINKIFAEDGDIVYPAAGVQNEDKLLVNVLLDAPGYKTAKLLIPAPKITLFTAPTGPGAAIASNTNILRDYVALFETTAGVALLSDGETVQDPVVPGSGDNIVNGRRISTKNSGPRLS